MRYQTNRIICIDTFLLSMVDLEVDPNEQGVKIRCSDIAILSSVYHGVELDKEELVSKIRSKRTEYPLIGNITSSDRYRYSLNCRLSENIRRGYIESDRGKYSITQEGISRMRNLIESTKEYLEDDDF